MLTRYDWVFTANIYQYIFYFEKIYLQLFSIFNWMSPFEAFTDTSFVNVKSVLFPVNFLKEKPLKWSEARRAAIRRDSSCRTCSSTDLLTVHHFWPRGVGGGNELENLVTLCEKCHQNICSTCSREKSARVPGWAHSEHRIKPLKNHISLKEIFHTPADQLAGRGFHAIPWMDFINSSSRKMALPWESGKESLLSEEQEQPEGYI